MCKDAVHKGGTQPPPPSAIQPGIAPSDMGTVILLIILWVALLVLVVLLCVVYSRTRHGVHVCGHPCQADQLSNAADAAVDADAPMAAATAVAGGLLNTNDSGSSKHNSNGSMGIGGIFGVQSVAPSSLSSSSNSSISRRPPRRPIAAVRRTGGNVSATMQERMRGRYVVLLKPDEVTQNHGFHSASTLSTHDARQAHVQQIHDHRHQQVQRILNSHDGTVNATHKFTSHRVAGFAGHMSEDTANQIRTHPDVHAVFPDAVITHCSYEHERGLPSRGVPWNVQYVGGDAPFTNKQPVDVYVIDTGVDATHPDLKDCIAESISFVPWETSGHDVNGHGTHVCGTIAANGRLKGVAPGAKLHVLKVLDANGEGSFSILLSALTYLVKQHQLHPTHRIVVNMSLGTLTDSDDLNAVDKLVQSMSRNMGIIFCAAAGNDGTIASRNSPGHVPEILTVGAFDQQYQWAPFSNNGTMVDFSAPGVHIVSCAIGGGYKTLSGTSMATPAVTGCVVRYLEDHFDASSDDVKLALITGSKTSHLPRIAMAPPNTCLDPVRIIVNT